MEERTAAVVPKAEVVVDVGRDVITVTQPARTSGVLLG